jgi:hypothetical protein
VREDKSRDHVYGKARREGKDRRGDHENGKLWKLLEQSVGG